MPGEGGPASAPVLVEREAGVATVTLNRPDVLNAIDAEMLEALVAALEQVAAGDDRAVVLAGAGRAFCAGADQGEMVPREAAEWERIVERYLDPVRLIAAIDAPVIARLHGDAVGGGLGLAMACDMRIAADSAVFGQPEVKLGIIPGFGGTQRLPRLVGPQKALEMNLIGDAITAAEAYETGLVNHIAPDHEMFDTALAFARKLAGQAPVAVAQIKRVSHKGDLDEGIEAEKAGFAAAFLSADAKEGIAAFLGKRTPQWKGE